jgi:putative ABC transport system permease protein
VNDLTYAFRQLSRTPGFTVMAVLTLGLGIGVNSTIFSVVNGMLLRPLPFHEPELLVQLNERNPDQGFERMSIAYANYADWRAQSQLFEDMGVYAETAYTLTGGEQAERLRGARVSAGLFSSLGVLPMLGRPFREGEDRSGADRVVLLSHGLWERRYGSDPFLVGRSVVVDGRSHVVVGIMPRGFRFPHFGELWTPLVGNPSDEARGSHDCLGIGRLKRGVSIEEARAELNLIAQRLAEAYPQTNRGVEVIVIPLRDELVRNFDTMLWLLLGVVGFVLAVACANVANLSLARAASRRHEMGIRAALGATRSRSFRQVLTESLVLGVLGGALGLVLTGWGLKLVVASVPVEIPYWVQLQLDPRVFGYTLVISVLAGLLFGSVPAWRASRSELHGALQEQGRGTSGGLGARHLRNSLVVAEVSLAVVLLAGTGLMIRSFLHLQRLDPGFNPAGLLTFALTLPERDAGGTAEPERFYGRVLDRLAALPGISGSAAVSHLPMGGSSWGNSFVLEDSVAQVLSQAPVGNTRVVTPGYFRVMEIALEAGRDFTEHDRADTVPVAIIDQTFARRYFGHEDPLGKRFKLGGGDSSAPWRTIVGVAGEVRHYGLGEEVRPGFYLPASQFPVRTMTVVTRTLRKDPLSVAPVVRQAVNELDSSLPLFRLLTMEEVVYRSIWQHRFFSQLFTVFAILAVVLAGIGIYGVTAHGVAQRTHELGVRMALGANAREVLRLVLGQGMGLVGLGLILGLLAGFGLLRLLASQLHGVRPYDPLTFALVALALAAVGLAACYVPARRATRVDPMAALRNQ